MSIRIYNTLGGKKEVFEPVTPGEVAMYVCGPTVYDSSHIGHARSVVIFDVIQRYFKWKDYKVTYVRNFTDVDDKIIAKANETGMSCEEVSEKFIDEFYRDMDALNCERAVIEPKATEHIEQIIAFVTRLIEKGMAYEMEGDVYFSVESFEGYGKLSGRRLEDMEAGARVDVDERKRNPFDFALWKSAKPDEPSWKSPWGNGRPGWHIECSAMSSEYLGVTFDIHGGGKDLIFPHHENEIAQSEGLSGKPFAKYWVHNGFVNIDQEKMSKSLGNFLMIKDVLKTCHPEAVRLFLLSSHYRSPIDYNDKAMAEAGAGLEKIYALLARAEKEAGVPGDGLEPGEYFHRFIEAMDDDFNSAKGIGVLFEAVRSINRTLDGAKGDITEDIKKEVNSAHGDILMMGEILGLLTISPDDFFENLKSKSMKEAAIDPKVVEDLIEQRARARKDKDWAKADSIRDKLDEMNIVLEDRADGTVWKIEDKK